MNCVSYYILDTNLLSDILFENISHSIGSTFTFVDSLLHCEKLFTLMQSPVFIFTFVSLVWGDTFKNMTLILISTSIAYFYKFYDLWSYI